MEEALAQPTRKNLYAVVRNNPGASAREVQRLAGLAWGETAYHLDQLVRAGALRRERGGRRDYYFTLEMTWEDRRLFLALRSTTQRAILLRLVESPGLSLVELTERTGASLSTISFHLRRLLDARLVEGERGPTVRTYRALYPEKVTALVQAYRASFRDRLVDRFVEAWGSLLR